MAGAYTEDSYEKSVVEPVSYTHLDVYKRQRPGQGDHRVCGRGYGRGVQGTGFPPEGD